MELAQIRVFLALAEELHFARTAERMGLSPGRVSQLIGALERDVGGALFTRTSRRVDLTETGRRLDLRLRPVLAELDAAVADVRHTTGAAPLRVRIAGSLTTAGRAWTALRQAAESARPDLHIDLVELPYGPDAYRQLRDGSAHALVYWNSPLPPGLAVGPVIDRQARVAMLGSGHPLAGEKSIEMAQVRRWTGGIAWAPQAVLDLFLPPAGLAGGEVVEVTDVRMSFWPRLVDVLAEGTLAHATVAAVGDVIHRADIVLVPIRDLPPIEVVLIWPEDSHEPGLRALVDVARDRADADAVP